MPNASPHPRPPAVCLLTNKSTEDAIAQVLFMALSHLEGSGIYVRVLFVDYSSTFNTIVPSRLNGKLWELGPGPEHLTVQLDPRLPDGPPPDGQSGWSNFLHTASQPRSTTGLCPQPSPLPPPVLLTGRRWPPWSCGLGKSTSSRR